MKQYISVYIKGGSHTGGLYHFGNFTLSTGKRKNGEIYAIFKGKRYTIERGNIYI